MELPMKNVEEENLKDNYQQLNTEQLQTVTVIDESDPFSLINKDVIELVEEKKCCWCCSYTSYTLYKDKQSQNPLLSIESSNLPCKDNIWEIFVYPSQIKKKVGYYSEKATCCGPPILDCYYGPKYIGSITDEDFGCYKCKYSLFFLRDDKGIVQYLIGDRPTFCQKCCCILDSCCSQRNNNCDNNCDCCCCLNSKRSGIYFNIREKDIENKPTGSFTLFHSWDECCYKTCNHYNSCIFKYPPNCSIEMKLLFLGVATFYDTKQ